MHRHLSTIPPIVTLIQLATCITLSGFGLSTCPPIRTRAPQPHALRSWQNMCVISFQFKFVWLPIPKTGSSSVRSLLVRSLCCSKPQDAACRPNTQLIFLQQVCPPSVLRTVSCPSIFSGQVFHGSNMTSRDFFYFSVARSPFSRALSSWNYGRLCYTNWVKEKKQQGSQEALPEYPKLQAALTIDAATQSPGYSLLPAPFLRWFETAHLGEQAPFLTDISGLPAVDMILNMEQLHSQFMCVLRLLNITTALLRPAHLRHFALDHCKHLHFTSAIASYYAADFALLSELGGNTQLTCNRTSRALVLGEGCNCSGVTYCVCKRPEDFKLQCDKLACSSSFTGSPCNPKLCEGAIMNVSLARFSI